MQRADHHKRLTAEASEVVEQAPGNSPGDVVGAAASALDSA
jgi:hypothetical protein